MAGGSSGWRLALRHPIRHRVAGIQPGRWIDKPAQDESVLRHGDLGPEDTADYRGKLVTGNADPDPRQRSPSRSAEKRRSSAPRMTKHDK